MRVLGIGEEALFYAYRVCGEVLSARALLLIYKKRMR